MAVSWLPRGFAHPDRVELSTGHHLRPIRGSDVDIDYPAVMGSRERLWSLYGDAWGWPPSTMTVEQDRADLERHEREMQAHESFNYALLDEGETELLGCVYIDPPDDPEDPADAIVSWWVVDQMVDTALEQELIEVIPEWLALTWPFDHVRFAI
jgi:hypothetical protein